MLGVRVEIIRYVDDAQPGWVECRLRDAWGHEHAFVDKVPIFTHSDLNESSRYPQPGTIACQEIQRRHDQGREIITIDTERPWHVESNSGETRFDVLATQLTNL
jgi:hypothetical protein